MTNNNILSKKAEEMTGYAYDCDCGRRHSVDIENIALGAGCVQKLPDILQKFKNNFTK